VAKNVRYKSFSE